MARHLVLAVVVALVLVSVAPQANGAAGTPITTCGQFVHTNAFLTGDLNCAGNPAYGVLAGASGITIDLRGFTIRGNASIQSAGVNAQFGYGAVTIKNGTLRNFEYGVYGGGDKFSVSNVDVSGSTHGGMWLFGDGIKIQSVTASGTGGTGIDIRGDAAVIQASSASHNAQAGFWVEGDGAKIQSSAASGNSAQGMYVAGNGTIIQSSSADGNGTEPLGFYRIGINVVGNAASIQKTTASGNPFEGMLVVGAQATIKSSIVVGNGRDGILVQGDAAKLNGNRADANGFAGNTSDGYGIGVANTGFTTPPLGTNAGQGNDDQSECYPANLC